MNSASFLHSHCHDYPKLVPDLCRPSPLLTLTLPAIDYLYVITVSPFLDFHMDGVKQDAILSVSFARHSISCCVACANLLSLPVTEQDGPSHGYSRLCSFI